MPVYSRPEAAFVAPDAQALAIVPETSDVGVGHELSGRDWLDSCWRCGSVDAVQDQLGRLLCPPCGALLAGAQPGPGVDPLRVVRSADWETHALERCWRCVSGRLDPDDTIGLCRSCRAALTAEGC
jgi:hypothetical protein